MFGATQFQHWQKDSAQIPSNRHNGYRFHQSNTGSQANDLPRPTKVFASASILEQSSISSSVVDSWCSDGMKTELLIDSLKIKPLQKAEASLKYVNFYP
jgi:hypothetical protein